MNELGKVIDANVNGEMISFMDVFPQMCALHSFPLSETVRLGARDQQGVHLDRDKVRDLVTVLTRWLYTGSFAPPGMAKVVISKGDDRLPLLTKAIRSCEPGTTFVVVSEMVARCGAYIARQTRPDDGITFTVATDPALAPVGECGCGAERAAEDGRCGDGCDDD